MVFLASHLFEHHPVERDVLIRLDGYGFYVYWYSKVREEVCFLDLATLEDVECCDYCKMYPLLEKSVATSNSESNKSHGKISPEKQFCLRLQIPFILNSCTYHRICNNAPQRTEEKIESCTLAMVPVEVTCDLKLWEEHLLNIAFRHRHVQENQAILDLLRKQWVFLTLVYSSHQELWTEGSNSRENMGSMECKFIPSCCISAALNLTPNQQEIPSIQIKDFTFELFFSLFLQSWPREDIADLFTKHSDCSGFMDLTGLYNFLTTLFPELFTPEAIPSQALNILVVRNLG
ncbi:hypothetical protein PHET_01174 [Paragonimus heterotremus]|uniref:Uncharacterized protein n=1 Tax=Paragonimus heterotremus TaxID=100268 RepID=A0A8J4TML8_9TREM|nr:hypothetical protein PHET_01174 [Paragonimus heterotremus]